MCVRLDSLCLCVLFWLLMIIGFVAMLFKTRVLFSVLNHNQHAGQLRASLEARAAGAGRRREDSVQTHRSNSNTGQAALAVLGVSLSVCASVCVSVPCVITLCLRLSESVCV